MRKSRRVTCLVIAFGTLLGNFPAIVLGGSTAQFRTDADSWTIILLDSGITVSARPKDGKASVGVMQDWILTLTSASGDPIFPAKISVGGGMKGHGHGLPTQPQVTAYGGNGDYLVEGVRLSMPGPWTLSFFVESQSGTFRADIEFDLSGPRTAANDVWTEEELRLLLTLRLPDNLIAPPSKSNAVADRIEAVELGRQFFFDSAFSENGKVSCATCHQPEKYFTDGLVKSFGISETLRNAPTLVGVAFNRWFYWDGRRDSLWSQALIPFESLDEMGTSRLAVVRRVATDPAYRSAYESLFGYLPHTQLEAIQVNHAGPLGSPEAREAWDRLDADSRNSINRAFSNIGKVIAAYERTLMPQATRLDRYLAALESGGDISPQVHLTESEIAGGKLFLDPQKTQCLQCHNGFLATNGEFQNIGSGNFSGVKLDFGRIFGLRAVLLDEFNCLGPYSDALPEQCVELRYLNRDSHIPLQGAFKAPSLRGLAHTSPYFHDGRFTTLEQVLEYYNHPPDQADVGPHELRTLDLSKLELLNLEQFLLTLSH